MKKIPTSALRRQPPRPTKTNGMTVRNRRLCLRRCKEANAPDSMVGYLPDELLIDILGRLSANDLYDRARLVCRHWCRLIHSDAFVCAHLHRTTSGLLLKSRRARIFVTATTQGRVEISKLSCRVKFPILCSCNGLALCLWDGKARTTPFIFNPATKCAFSLPRFPVDPVCDGLGMAYAAASMAYKVVGTYHNRKLGITHCVILTVGVDKNWRIAEVEGLSPEARWLIRGPSTPLVTGCFLHWVSKTLVVSFNVETENFTLTPSRALKYPQQSYFHLSTGECLSLLISCGDNWSWEVWEMKPETWEWRKVLPNLDLAACKCKIQQFALREDDVLKPVGWVRYPQVLAFSFKYTGGYCIIYNIDTKEFESVELSRNTIVQHRNTLVWTERC